MSKEEKRILKVKEKLGPFVENFKAWISQITDFASYNYLVAVDVGATNTRVSVHFYKDANTEKGFDLCKLQCSCTAKLVDFLKIIGEQTIDPLFQGKHAVAAVLAVAGPVLPSGIEVRKISSHQK